MTHSHVYGTEKLRTTPFFDEKRCIGARVENLLSGRSADIGADRVVIVWSESERGKKRTFDTSCGELLSVDSDGYAVRSADGLFEVHGLQFPAAHTVSATLSPFEIRFSTESSLRFMSL